MVELTQQEVLWIAQLLNDRSHGLKLKPIGAKNVFEVVKFSQKLSKLIEDYLNWLDGNTDFDQEKGVKQLKKEKMEEAQEKWAEKVKVDFKLTLTDNENLSKVLTGKGVESLLQYNLVELK